MNKEDLAKEIQRLVEIMEKLRGPEGCPWDRKQTIPSLQEYLIEEAYEVVEAAQKEDRTLLKEELGDVLLQIVFQAQIAREEGTFDLLDVVKGLADKLVRRHPHVFLIERQILLKRSVNSGRKSRLKKRKRKRSH